MTNLRACALLALVPLLALAGPAAAGVKVTVRGVDGPERENIEARLSLLAYANEDGEDEAEVRRLHRRAEDDIRGALEAFGYYNPQVRGRLSGSGTSWSWRTTSSSGCCRRPRCSRAMPTWRPAASRPTPWAATSTSSSACPVTGSAS